MPPRRRKFKRPMRKGPRLTFGKKVCKVLDRCTESKVYDKFTGNASANNFLQSYGALYYLSGTEQGTEAYQRVGNTISPKMLDLRMLLRFYVTGALSTTYWGNPARIIIFSYDCSQASVGGGASSPAIPRIEDVLDMDPTLPLPPAIGAGSDLLTRPYNNRNRLAYTILYDKTFGNNGQGNNFTPIHVKLSGKKLPSKITYSGFTDSTSNAGRNAIFMIACSLFNGSGDDSGALLSFQSHLKYKDA